MKECEVWMDGVGGGREVMVRSVTRNEGMVRCGWRREWIVM